jgi:hypothetical protein
MLEALGFQFTPAPPFSIDPSGSTSDDFEVTVNSQAECAALALPLPGGVPTIITPSQVNVDNLMTVTWDSGTAQCTARVVCAPPPCVDNCVPPTTGATRTMGFLKTHESALSQCLAGGAIDLGFMSVSTLESALGLLWGSPSSFGDGTTRADLDKARFLLARQTLVGICNQRLFGTTPGALLSNAVAALSGQNCTLIGSIEGLVDAFNGSGDAVAFPSGFNAGPATPKHAQSIAVDPTSPSGLSCQ